MWKSFIEHWKWAIAFGLLLAGWWIFCLVFPAWNKRRSRSRLLGHSSSPAGQLDPDGWPLLKPLPKSQLSPSRSLSPTDTISQSLLDSLEESAAQAELAKLNVVFPPYTTTTAHNSWALATTPTPPIVRLPGGGWVRLPGGGWGLAQEQPTPVAEQLPTKHVYGFRGWHLDVSNSRKYWDVTGKPVQESSLKLLPSNKQYGEWFPGANEAVCRRGHSSMPAQDSPHRAGASGCSCGFWCLHRLREVANNVPRPQSGQDFGGLVTYTVWGSIVGWGQCTRQGNGWRCERAQVVAFMDVPVQHVRLPQIVWGTAACPYCGKTISGTTAARTAGTSYRPTLSHACASIHHVVQLYPEIGPKEFIYTADTPLRAYREHLKLLSERFDVPLVAEAELEAFTEKTAREMYEQYEEG